MNNMKKLVAALLVLTMVLALAAVAVAECKFDRYECVRFTKNTVAYNHKNGKATNTVVSKGSYAMVECVSGNWVRLWLDLEGKVKRWFKTDNLTHGGEGKYLAEFGMYLPVYVTYSQGGVGKSREEKYLQFDDTDPVDELDYNNWRISPDNRKHVKATAQVWLHKEASLKQSYGVALHKDDVVKYRRVWAFDSRLIQFYGVKYKGKCLWVSSYYSKIVV